MRGERVRGRRRVLGLARFALPMSSIWFLVPLFCCVPIPAPSRASLSSTVESFPIQSSLSALPGTRVLPPTERHCSCSGLGLTVQCESSPLSTFVCSSQHAVLESQAGKATLGFGGAVWLSLGDSAVRGLGVRGVPMARAPPPLRDSISAISDPAATPTSHNRSGGCSFFPPWVRRWCSSGMPVRL